MMDSKGRLYTWKNRSNKGISLTLPIMTGTHVTVTVILGKRALLLHA